MEGFSVAFTVRHVLLAFAGCIMGLVVGAMPGIGSLAGVALLLPLTFNFDPTAGIILLGALYYSNMFGGAFSSILLNVPGDSPAIMTTLDGYPMAQKGKPGQALFTSNVSSFLGGMIGWVILVMSGPALARFGLKFGPPEMALLFLLAMTSISWLIDGKVSKGLVITCFGMVLATMGMDALIGHARYHFGSIYLLGGLPFISIAIGLVGFATVIELMGVRHDPVKINESRLTIRGSLLSRRELRRITLPVLRSGFLGTFIGVLPGAGATAGSMMCYAIQRKFKNEEPLGSGAVEGIAAVESANNAAAAGAFAPLLALGIPGSGTGAVLLGGLMMWGLNPGPLLFTNHADFAWGLIASLFITNIMALMVSLMVIPWIIKVIKVPIPILILSITIVCFVGSYSTSGSMFGVLLMVLAGFVGFTMKKYGYPRAPLILAFVLSRNFELNIRRSFLMSSGSFSIFLGSTIAIVEVLILLIVIIIPLSKAIYGKVKGIK